MPLVNMDTVETQCVSANVFVTSAHADCRQPSAVASEIEAERIEWFLSLFRMDSSRALERANVNKLNHIHTQTLTLTQIEVICGYMLAVPYAL